MAPSSLFIVLTHEEAAALVEHGDTAAAIRGLAKIRRALEGARAERPEVLPDVPPLRAKHYQPRSAITSTHRRFLAVDPPVQPHVRPGPRERSTSSSSSSSCEEDDYVPFRDEADGIYT